MPRVIVNITDEQGVLLDRFAIGEEFAADREIADRVRFLCETDNYEIEEIDEDANTRS